MPRCFRCDTLDDFTNLRSKVLDNDFIDCIVLLPQTSPAWLDYTGDLYILSNKKPKKRKGKIQLIDASKKLSINEVLHLYAAYNNNDVSHIITSTPIDLIRL